jgi:hypothetical protein
VERVKMAAGDETLEFKVDGKSVKVVTRPADGEGLARLFDLGTSTTWDDESPLSVDDYETVVRGLMARAGRKGEQAEVLGVPPAAALAFPPEARISVCPVEPVSFSLPGSPSGLVLEQDDRGDGHLWGLGASKVDLGREGMWWIVSRLIEALENPTTVAQWPRFLTLGSTVGGPATQVSLECGEWGVGLLWRSLDNGVVGDIVAVQELTYERANGWLAILLPVRDDLERRRSHRQRLRPARMAEKWARAMERWASPTTATPERVAVAV